MGAEEREKNMANVPWLDDRQYVEKETPVKEEIKPADDDFFYLQLPIDFIRLLLAANKQGIENVFWYAVYFTAIKMHPSPKDVVKSILLWYSTDNENLPHRAREKLDSLEYDELEELDIDEDRGGYFDASGMVKEPSDETIEFVYDLLNEDGGWYECELVHSVKFVCDNCSVVFKPELIELCSTVWKKYEAVPTDVWAYVSTSVFLRFLQAAKRKGVSERYRVKFCMYAALKSIIGLDDVATAPKRLILARLFGCRSSTEDLNEFLSRRGREKAEALYRKYKWRLFKPLIIEMLNEGWIRCVWTRQTRGKAGYTFSFRITEDEAQALEIEREKAEIKKKKRVKEASLEYEKKRRAMLDEMNKKTT